MKLQACQTMHHNIFVYLIENNKSNHLSTGIYSEV